MTSGPKWTIEYLQSTIKTFKKIDPQDRKRIRSFLEDRLARLNDPRQLGKALQGSSQDFWRYRVGNYRIICDVRDEALVVLVVKVGHRKEIYR